MADEKRDKVNAVTESPTGVNRVKLANMEANAQDDSLNEEFKRPVYIQSRQDSRAYIAIYKKSGELLKKFDKVIVSNLSSGDNERVARTPVRDGVHRRHMGRDARQIEFTAQFYNTVSQPWFDNFMDIWDNWLRGTKLDERDASAYVKINDHIYVGTFAGYRYAETSENDIIVSGSLVMDVDDVLYNYGQTTTTGLSNQNVAKKMFEVKKDKL